MKPLSAIFVFLSTVLVLYSCDRPVPEPTYLPLNSEFKAWCAYKPGTWWTYKEISSSNTDSMWVSYYDEEKKQAPDNFNYYKLWMRIASQNDSFVIHYYHGEPGWTNTNEWALVENYTFNQGSFGAGRHYFSTANLDLPPNMVLISLDSLVLTGSGDTFYNVKKISNSISEYGNWIKNEYYSRNIGVIRREMFNGEIWEIENYNIVQ